MNGISVVRLITRLNIGGPARQALLLTRALAPEFDTVLGVGTPAPEEGELGDERVTVHRLPLVRPVSFATDARALLAVRQLLQATRPRVVHTHMAKAGTIGRVAAATIRPRPALVHTFHGHVLDGYFRPAVERAFVATERLLARRSDVLVAVSQEVRADLLERGIGTPEQVRVIPLGLDLGEHRTVSGPSGVLRSTLGIGADVPLVGTVGRLVPIKDHDTLLKAMTSLPDTHLAVVGDGELRSTLEARCRDLGIAHRVHFTGWRLDVPEIMADLDVVALSSRNEGTPVSLIEAAACARAVVATDVGGVRTVVTDGETGLLVPAGDPPALAAALDRALGNVALRERMGAEGRVRSHRFDDERLVADIRSLYRELLG